MSTAEFSVFGQLLHQKLGESLAHVLVNKNMLEEELVAQLSEMDSNIYILEFLISLEETLVQLNAFALAKIVNTHINYNFKKE